MANSLLTPTATPVASGSGSRVLPSPPAPGSPSSTSASTSDVEDEDDDSRTVIRNANQRHGHHHHHHQHHTHAPKRATTREFDDEALDPLDPGPLAPITSPAVATPSISAVDSRGNGVSPWPFGESHSDLHDMANRRNSLVSVSNPVIDPSAMAWEPTERRKSRTSASSSLPHEILLHILRLVTSVSDLRRSLLVCKAWCQCGVELLWHKPVFSSASSLYKMFTILGKPASTFSYALFIRRLNFSGLADSVNDSVLVKLAVCERLERLTLAGCTKVTDEGVTKVIERCLGLVALDLSDIKTVGDKSIVAVGKSCRKLQGLNLSGCSAVTDKGIDAVARGCPAIRRIKLRHLNLVTSLSMLSLTAHCPLLLEVDLVSCTGVRDEGLWGLWRYSSFLRELSLGNMTNLTDEAFPTKEGVENGWMIGGSMARGFAGTEGTSMTTTPIIEPDRDMVPFGDSGTVSGDMEDEDDPSSANDANGVGPSAQGGQVPPPPSPSGSASGSQPSSSSPPPPSPTGIPPLTLPPTKPISPRNFDHIRYLDLTSLSGLTDAAIASVTNYMPRIRNLILAKCTGLTDESVRSVCKLGKNLHYLHLGHVGSITDRAVTQLARSCTRLRYIDLACCPLLTDMSVFELASNLPRLKRIGLVRVNNLTDQAVTSLVERTSLERIHLSYCEHVTVDAIHFLLQRLNRLTHLSLTGVPAFRRPDLQKWCRPPPQDFNSHQRSAFCVYSGKGVGELRRHLNTIYPPEPPQNADLQMGSAHLAHRSGRGVQVMIPGMPPANPSPSLAAALQRQQIERDERAAAGLPPIRQPAPALPAHYYLPGQPTGEQREWLLERGYQDLLERGYTNPLPGPHPRDPTQRPRGAQEGSSQTAQEGGSPYHNQQFTHWPPGPDTRATDTRATWRSRIVGAERGSRQGSNAGDNELGYGISQGSSSRSSSHDEGVRRSSQWLHSGRADQPAGLGSNSQARNSSPSLTSSRHGLEPSSSSSRAGGGLGSTFIDYSNDPRLSGASSSSSAASSIRNSSSHQHAHHHHHHHHRHHQNGSSSSSAQQPSTLYYTPGLPIEGRSAGGISATPDLITAEEGHSNLTRRVSAPSGSLLGEGSHGRDLTAGGAGSSRPRGRGRTPVPMNVDDALFDEGGGNGFSRDHDLD